MTDTPDPRPLHGRLSRCQYEIFVRVAKGEQQRVIAADMNMSTGAVSVLLRRAKQKTGLETTAEIAVYAFKNGIGLK